MTSIDNPVVYRARGKTPPPTVWTGGFRPVTPAERKVIAAWIATVRLAEKIPEGLPDVAYPTNDETTDVIKALNLSGILIIYVAQAELRRHGLL